VSSATRKRLSRKGFSVGELSSGVVECHPIATRLGELVGELAGDLTR
jgi:predicted nuclease with RNAse H fold